MLIRDISVRKVFKFFDYMYEVLFRVNCYCFVLKFIIYNKNIYFVV